MVNCGDGLNQPGIIKTVNGCGWTSTVPNQITCAAIDFIRNREGCQTVLDIGAGLGVATLPFLEGGAHVIALDTEEAHLAAIRREAQLRGLDQYLTIIQGEFPFVSPPSVDVVHASNILHFLDGEKIKFGAREIRRWLRPGGRVFIQVGTIYAGHITRLLPEFESRRLRGIEWAGETHRAKEYVSAEYRDATPDYMNYLYDAPLVAAFEAAGFRTLEARYYTRTGLPADLRKDGREHFGYIGCVSGEK